jgi:hypothetical protein
MSSEFCGTFRQRRARSMTPHERGWRLLRAPTPKAPLSQFISTSRPATAGAASRRAAARAARSVRRRVDCAAVRLIRSRGRFSYAACAVRRSNAAGLMRPADEWRRRWL